MSEWITQFLSIGAISLLGAVSPGPDFVLISKQSLLGSRKAGLYTAFGIGSGLFLHLLLALIGISVLLQKNPFIYLLFKYACAAYLIFLGIQLLKPQKVPLSVTAPSLLPSRQIKSFSTGFFCNALNPKASLFALSIFSQLIAPSTPLFLQSIFALEMVLITIGWFAILSLFLTHERFRQKYLKFQPRIMFIMGLFLLLLGIKAAM